MNTSLAIARKLNFWATKSFVDSAILHAALHLHLFEAVPIEGQGALTVAELAQRLRASERGTRVLCEPLVSSALLASDAEGRLCLRTAFSQLHDPVTLAYLHDEAAWWQPSAQLVQAIRANAPITYEGKAWDLLAHYHSMRPTVRPIDSFTIATLTERVKHFFLYTQALIAAATLDVFTHLSHTPITAGELAESLHLPEAALAVLLETLTSMEVLIGTEAGYAYPEAGRTEFTQRKMNAYGQLLFVTSLQWEAFGRLDQAVVHDRRVLDLHEATLGGQFYAALARYNTSVFPSYFSITRDIPRAVRALRPEGELAVLDIGAGSGVWGAAFTYLDPSSHVTFFDQEPVLPQARRNLERLGCLHRASFQAGDLLHADFGLETYDIILLGQICHTQTLDALPNLFARIRRALRPRGYLVVADLVLSERRSEPLEYLYFNVKEFMSTSGEVLSLSEYHHLLVNADLRTQRAYALPGIDVIFASHDDAPFPERLEHQTERVIEMDQSITGLIGSASQR